MPPARRRPQPSSARSAAPGSPVRRGSVIPMTRPGEYLRQNRIKIALWVAVIEGVLVIVHLIPHLAIYVVAVVAVFFYAAAGRNYKSALGRQLAWIFAASQAATVLIPIVWF